MIKKRGWGKTTVQVEVAIVVPRSYGVTRQGGKSNRPQAKKTKREKIQNDEAAMWWCSCPLEVVARLPSQTVDLVFLFAVRAVTCFPGVAYAQSLSPPASRCPRAMYTPAQAHQPISAPLHKRVYVSKASRLAPGEEEGPQRGK